MDICKYLPNIIRVRYIDRFVLLHVSNGQTCFITEISSFKFVQLYVFIFRTSDQKHIFDIKRNRDFISEILKFDFAINV